MEFSITPESLENVKEVTKSDLLNKPCQLPTVWKAGADSIVPWEKLDRYSPEGILVLHFNILLEDYKSM